MNLHVFGIAGLMLSAMAGQAQAGVIKVLFLGYDDHVADSFADIMGSVGSDTRFDYANSGSIQDQSASFLPSLAVLQQYDSVLVWTNNAPSAGLGDRLADYVDAGGGVVLATFDGYYKDPNHPIDYFPGRINTAGYNPFTGGTTDAYNNNSLGVYDNLSPLFAGVNSLTSARYNGDWTGVDAGATLAGSWDSGRPLAGISASGRVANISLFPNVATYGHATGDYQQLFRNALAETAAGSTAVPEPSSLAMLGVGAIGLVVARRKRQQKKLTV